MSKAKEIHRRYSNDPLKGYDGKWRNLYFTKSGKSYNDLDKNVRNTKYEVIILYDIAMRFREQGIEQGIHGHFIFACGSRVSAIEISHALPMPISDT